jgi:signal peptide peptidase SppA
MIVPSAHTAMMEAWLLRAQGKAAPEKSATANANKLPATVREEDLPGGVRLVSFCGTLMKRPDYCERVLDGAVDTDEVTDAVRRACAEAGALVLAIDSPGGEVTGIEELAALVAHVPMPTFAFTDSCMASAAYYIGSQAGALAVSPSAVVGSVGVYSVVMDISGLLEKFGVRAELFKAGKYKAAGVPGTKLSDDQREMFQARVESIHESFKSAVVSRRPNVRAEHMEGQIFSGREAVANGMATGLESSLEAVCRRAAESVARKN